MGSEYNDIQNLNDGVSTSNDINFVKEAHDLCKKFGYSKFFFAYLKKRHVDGGEDWATGSNYVSEGLVDTLELSIDTLREMIDGAAGDIK